MMNRTMIVVAAVGLTLVASGCATHTATVNGVPNTPLGGGKVKIKILLKRQDGKCLARVLPNKAELEQGEDSTLEWTIRQAPGSNCLPSGVDLQLNFTSPGNPTACNALQTSSGNKQKIECDLGTYSTNTVYKYDVKLVGTVNETLLDPEVEIVQF